MRRLYRSFFMDNVQAGPHRAPGPPRVPSLLLACLLSLAAPALAGPTGSTYGPPPELPTPDATDEEPPRRDIHMGTVDNMRMGRDAEGNIVMEVGPPRKNEENQPSVGPFFIYPQIGTMPGSGQRPYPSRGGQMGQGQPRPDTRMPGTPGQTTMPGQTGLGARGSGATTPPQTGTRSGTTDQGLSDTDLGNPAALYGPSSAPAN